MIILLDYEKIALELSRKDIFAREEGRRVQSRDRSDKIIWIAEDSEMLRMLIIETLEEAGYHGLKWFINGKDAFDAFEQGSNCDLLITDIEMPKMDGLHLTKRLREDDRYAELPIIVFSSLISDDLRHKGESVGVNAQITKPEMSAFLIYSIAQRRASRFFPVNTSSQTTRNSTMHCSIRSTISCVPVIEPDSASFSSSSKSSAKSSAATE